MPTKTMLLVKDLEINLGWVETDKTEEKVFPFTWGRSTELVDASIKLTASIDSGCPDSYVQIYFNGYDICSAKFKGWDTGPISCQASVINYVINGDNKIEMRAHKGLGCFFPRKFTVSVYLTYTYESKRPPAGDGGDTGEPEEPRVGEPGSKYEYYVKKYAPYALIGAGVGVGLVYIGREKK